MTQKFFRILFIIGLLGAPGISWGQTANVLGTAVIDGKTLYAVETPNGGVEVLSDGPQKNPENISIVELKPGKPEEIARTRPSAIRNFLAMEGDIVKQTTVRFVPESFSFFMAIGAVNFVQLMTNYSANPISLEQHFQSLKDPIGHLGFYTFMLANRQTGAILSGISQNPTLNRHLFPFIGMGAGMMASNIVHEVAHDKDLMTCAKNIFNKTKSQEIQSSCDKAYDTWVAHFYEKRYNFTIQLASLSAATYLSQAVHKKISARIAKRYLEIYGVDMAIGLIPGTVPFKVVKWVSTISNFGLFTQFDQWVSALIRAPINNVLLSRNFADLSYSLNKNIMEKKSQGWKSNIDMQDCLFGGRVDFVFGKDPKACDDLLMKDLQELTHKMNKWRELNLEKVYTAHNSWITMVNKVVGTYAFSQTTYNNFINWAQKTEAINNPLVSPQPLWGVNTETFVGQEHLLTGPRASLFINGQLAYLDKVNEWLEQKIADESLNNFLPAEKNLILEIKNKLSTKSVSTIGQGLLQMNNLIRSQQSSPDLVSFLYELRQKIGNPKPALRMGDFFTSMNDHATKAFEKPELKNWGLKIGDFTPQTPTEMVIANMLCGGERAEVEKTIGFSPTFAPPKITQKSPSQCEVGSNRPAIAFSALQIIEPNGELHPNATQYALHYLLPELKQGNPNDWWMKNNDPVLLSWFQKEKYKYNNIIGEMLNVFHNKKDSRFNANGMVGNGIADSFRQEVKVYLLVLSEILKAQKMTLATNKALLITNLFSNQLEPSVNPVAVLENGYRPFLKSVRYNDNLNFNQVMGLIISDISGGRTIRIFDRILGILNEMDAAFPKAKWEKENALSRGSIMVIRNDLKNSDIANIEKKLMAELEILVKVLDATIENKTQKSLAVYCIKSLSQLFSSYSSFAQIANLMSFERNRNDNEKAALEPVQQICTEGQGGKNSITNKAAQAECNK